MVDLSQVLVSGLRNTEMTELDTTPCVGSSRLAFLGFPLFRSFRFALPAFLQSFEKGFLVLCHSGFVDRLRAENFTASLVLTTRFATIETFPFIRSYSKCTALLDMLNTIPRIGLLHKAILVVGRGTLRLAERLPCDLPMGWTERRGT